MMTIFLRKTNGKGEKLQISQKITIETLFQQVCKALNYPTAQNRNNNPPIDCYHRGVKLQHDSQESIEEQGITGNSIIHVVEVPPVADSLEEGNEDIHVKLIIKNKLFEYSISVDNKIEDLKQNVCEDLEIKEEDLTLSYLGIELDDTKTVREYQFSSGVLISAFAATDINSSKFAKQHSVSRESYSEESQGIPKIVRKGNNPLKKIKKTESMSVQPTLDLKGKSINFCSVRLNKIEEKNDESKIESQINESEENSQEEDTSEVEEEPSPSPQQKPKLTLDLLSKPWYGDQKIIETESIVGDEESQEAYTDCQVEFTRIDKKRQYVVECSGTHTFQDAQKTLARLQKVEPSCIKINLHLLDQVTKSAISNRSSKGIQSSPKSSESIRKQRSSHECGRLSVQRSQGLKARIVQMAGKMKSKIISIEFETIHDI